MASSVISYSPSIRARSCSAANRALISLRSSAIPGMARSTAHSWAWIASARTTPVRAPAPASVNRVGRSSVKSLQRAPIVIMAPATRSELAAR